MNCVCQPNFLPSILENMKRNVDLNNTVCLQPLWNMSFEHVSHLSHKTLACFPNCSTPPSGQATLTCSAACSLRGGHLGKDFHGLRRNVDAHIRAVSSNLPRHALQSLGEPQTLHLHSYKTEWLSNSQPKFGLQELNDSTERPCEYLIQRRLGSAPPPLSVASPAYFTSKLEGNGACSFFSIYEWCWPLKSCPLEADVLPFSTLAWNPIATADSDKAALKARCQKVLCAHLLGRHSFFTCSPSGLPATYLCG